MPVRGACSRSVLIIAHFCRLQLPILVTVRSHEGSPSHRHRIPRSAVFGLNMPSIRLTVFDAGQCHLRSPPRAALSLLIWLLIWRRMPSVRLVTRLLTHVSESAALSVRQTHNPPMMRRDLRRPGGRFPSASSLLAKNRLRPDLTERSPLGRVLVVRDPVDNRANHA